MASPAVEGLAPLVRGLVATLGAAMAAHEATKDRPQVGTRDTDCADHPNESQCNLCKLRDGYLSPARGGRYMVRKNRFNYDYQIYIANLHAAPERFGYVEKGDPSNAIVSPDFGAFTNFLRGVGGVRYTTLEWNYNSVEFDGFWRGLCTVVETKANFEQFFDEEGDPKYRFVTFIVKKWAEQQNKQLSAIASAMPQAKLEWHFAQPTPYQAAIGGGLNPALCHLTFMVLEN